MSTNSENFVKIGPVNYKIFSDIFTVSSQEFKFVTLLSLGLLEQYLYQFAQCVLKILSLNIFNQNCNIPVCFGMLACQMKVSSQILPKIDFHGNIP